MNKHTPAPSAIATTSRSSLKASLAVSSRPYTRGIAYLTHTGRAGRESTATGEETGKTSLVDSSSSRCISSSLCIRTSGVSGDPLCRQGGRTGLPANRYEAIRIRDSHEIALLGEAVQLDLVRHADVHLPVGLTELKPLGNQPLVPRAPLTSASVSSPSTCDRLGPATAFGGWSSASAPNGLLPNIFPALDVTGSSG